jgi:hypothetical protein
MSRYEVKRHWKPFARVYIRLVSTLVRLIGGFLPSRIAGYPRLCHFFLTALRLPLYKVSEKGIGNG